MSERKWTPGPWVAHEGCVSEGARAGWCHIADCRGLVRWRDSRQHGDQMTVEANATLIAASPDLFEAASDIIGVAPLHMLDGVADEDLVEFVVPVGHLRALSAALSKALGSGGGE